MKGLIFCILTFFGTLYAGPKVVGHFGPAQCPWSEQLRQDVWNCPTFHALLKGAEIEMVEEEGVGSGRDLPALVLFSDSGKEIGSLGYLVIPPEKYVDLLKEMLTIDTLCESISSLSVQHLLQLYRKSELFGMTSCREKLLQEGLLRDEGTQFLVEHYAQLVKDHPRRARKVKQKIRSRQPADPGVEWEMSLLEFQAKREKQLETAAVVRPLEKFLRRYGAQNLDYSWRAHLMLAEFYRDRNLFEQGKYHTKLAADEAPQELKWAIASTEDRSL